MPIELNAPGKTFVPVGSAEFEVFLHSRRHIGPSALRPLSVVEPRFSSCDLRVSLLNRIGGMSLSRWFASAIRNYMIAFGCSR